MRRMMLSAAAGVAALAMSAISGCASYPTESITQGGEEASIAFDGFPDGAQILINGQSASVVGDYDGRKQKLAVPTGTHRVQIVHGGGILLDKKVYVGRNSTLTVSPE